MKVKDNLHRCPWCGNLFPELAVEEFLSGNKKCPYCGHYFCRKNDKSRLLAVPILLLVFYLIGSKILEAFLIIPIEILLIISFWHLNLVGPFIKCRETPLPTKGYKVKISLFQRQLKRRLLNDTVIPIVFINKEGKPVSLMCCVRIESGKWNKGFFECDLKLLEFGEVPQEETNKIYLYNKGEIIASGDVVSILPVSY